MTRLEQALIAVLLLGVIAAGSWLGGSASGRQDAGLTCQINIKTLTEAASAAMAQQASQALERERAAAASYAQNLAHYEETRREDARRIADLRAGRGGVYYIAAASCTATRDLPAIATDPASPAGFWAELPAETAADLESLAADADRDIGLCLATLKTDRGMP